MSFMWKCKCGAANSPFALPFCQFCDEPRPPLEATYAIPILYAEQKEKEALRASGGQGVEDEIVAALDFIIAQEEKREVR